MNWQNSLFALTNASISKRLVRDSERLYQYSICVTLGVLSGATSVALMTGLAIVVYSLLFEMIFAPGVMLLIITSTLVGLGIARLLGQIMGGILPGLSNNKAGMQMILAFSILTTLLLPLFFEYLIIKAN